jgi:hypothetical protein
MIRHRPPYMTNQDSRDATDPLDWYGGYRSDFKKQVFTLKQSYDSYLGQIPEQNSEWIRPRARRWWGKRLNSTEVILSSPFMCSRDGQQTPQDSQLVISKEFPLET